MSPVLAILTALDRCQTPAGHLAMPEASLQSDVNFILSHPITLGTLRRELTILESSREVVSVEHRDRGTLWKITAQGRARLAE